MEFSTRLRMQSLWLATLLALAVGAHAHAADKWVGLWLGRTGGDREIDVLIEVIAGDMPKATLTLPVATLINEPVSALAIENGTLKGWVNPGLGRISLSLTLTAGVADAAEGTLQLTPPGAKSASDLPLKVVRRPRAESLATAKTWVATLEMPGANLDMGLVLAVVPGGVSVGSFSVPSQNLKNIPVMVERSGEAWDIHVPVQVPARILLAPIEDRLEGRFQQGTVDAAIAFHRGEAAAQTPGPKRPQTPKGPFPYTEQTVTVKHPSGHVLTGTLTLPEGASASSPVPGVVFATGSGPQNRDEAIMGHAPFLVLADALVRAGIAVLRCDDRGIGESTGDFARATTIDFASDLNAQFEFVKTVPQIDPARVGLLGHSEGGILVAIVAANAAQAAVSNPPAFVVMMAGTGVPGGQVLRAQNEAILRAAKLDEESITKLCAAHAALMDAAEAGADDAALLPLATNLVHLQLEQARIAGQQIPPEAESVYARSAVAAMSQPWMRLFIKLDPAEYLRNVKAPVLALNGTLDLQVLPSQNLPPIRAALAQSGAELTVKEYPGMNHLFQSVRTGGIEEYAATEITIDPKVLRDIAGWIRKQTGVTRSWTEPTVAPAAPAVPAAAAPTAAPAPAGTPR